VYLLDTDICIYLLNAAAPAAVERLRDTPLDELGTTSITAAELRYGALHSAKPEANLGRVQVFLAP
jgi:tRNA(fMet)-specific endonuclease VapC